jgi:lysophospholipase L1-like esterase
MTTFTRYIALGDSMTEGMCDEIIAGQYRGWADRAAEALAQLSTEFSYFNLAVRGKLLGQVIAEQIPVAKQFIEGKQTLVSFHAGGNDVLRPKYKPEITLALYEKGARELAGTGATLLLFTVVEKATGNGKTAELWESRFGEFNNQVRKVAAELDAILIEWNVAQFLADRRFLAPDRLHLNADGHQRVAHAVLEALGAPFDNNWKVPLPPAPKVKKSAELAADIRWFLDFAWPWIWRRIRGKSSGDGRTAKHQKPQNLPE